MQCRCHARHRSVCFVELSAVQHSCSAHGSRAVDGDGEPRRMRSIHQREAMLQRHQQCRQLGQPRCVGELSSQASLQPALASSSSLAELQMLMSRRSLSSTLLLSTLLMLLVHTRETRIGKPISSSNPVKSISINERIKESNNHHCHFAHQTVRFGVSAELQIAANREIVYFAAFVRTRQ